jgi:hypothetical protein
MPSDLHGDFHGDPTAVASPRRLWGWAILIALAGVAVRALWYLQFKEEIPFRLGPDGNIYIAQAKAILNGSIGDPSAPGLATSLREFLPPGYPLFLAGVWGLLPRGDVFRQPDYVLLVVFGVQWVLAGLTTLMTFAISRRVLFGWSALIPPALITLSVAFVDIPNLFANETLLAFLLTAAVLLLVKAHNDALPALSERPWQEKPPRSWQWLYCVGAGMALSAAILVQPRIALLLPFAAWWLIRAARGRYAVLFLVFALLLPGAWIIRDYQQYDELVPISLSPEAALFNDNVDPIGGAGTTDQLQAPGCNAFVLNSQDFQEHVVWGHCMVRAGANQIVDHPGRSALAVPDRLAALFSPWDPQFARGRYSSDKWGYQDIIPASLRRDTTFDNARQILAVVLMVLYVLMLLVGVVGLWLEGPGSQARMIAIPLVTLPLIHLIFHAENRFRLPLVPLISIAITLGVLTCWDAVSAGRRKS